MCLKNFLHINRDQLEQEDVQLLWEDVFYFFSNGYARPRSVLKTWLSLAILDMPGEK